MYKILQIYSFEFEIVIFTKALKTAIWSAEYYHGLCECRLGFSIIKLFIPYISCESKEQFTLILFQQEMSPETVLCVNLKYISIMSVLWTCTCHVPVCSEKTNLLFLK